jgi:hypothetical protein
VVMRARGNERETRKTRLLSFAAPRLVATLESARL